ncbi:hypothetical protein CFP56_002914 [Quercus suber]|uniref:PB1-like domain-containing protein n=1 Tax=Quercus suber TaxID=58331 RepID=A0AAW0LF39_QUESU
MGGSVHTLTKIDPNKLSFFEIRDLCHLVGASKEHSRYRYLLPEGELEHDLRVIETDLGVVNMTTLHRAWPTNKIIIYTDIDVEPLAVEHPDGGGVVEISGDGGGDGGKKANEIGKRIRVATKDQEEGSSVKALDEFLRTILAKTTLEFHNQYT